ncbi:hypothetical protein PPRFG01_0035500 [Plasmodium sp.]|nr:hypothetical protein PPRFG01_0035500 [Plasmodium sp.]
MVCRRHVCEVEHMRYHVVCIVNHGLYDRHIHVGVSSAVRRLKWGSLYVVSKKWTKNFDKNGPKLIYPPL